jgi:CubicO group peptidase (beta-lactamase class C family)
MGPAVSYLEASACAGNDPSLITSDSALFSKAISEAREKVIALKDQYSIPGLAVCVAVDGAIVWNEGFGCADYARQVPIHTTSTFRVGSVAKSMTGIALMKLHQEGKLDFDESLRSYVPDFPEKKYSMKIKEIAGHQSGIRHYKKLEMASNRSFLTIEEGLSIFKDDPLLFEPGTEYQYSTYGYSVLARVIENISKKDYLTYMQKEVFAPLKMTSTTAAKKALPFVGYSSAPGKDKVKNALEVDLSNKWAGGGFLSTPRDLTQMMINLDSLLSRKSQQLLFTDQILKNGEKTGYGIGFNVVKTEETKKTLIHHGGSSIGGRSYLMKIVEDDVVIAFCANSDTGIMNAANYNAAEVFEISKLFFKK